MPSMHIHFVSIFPEIYTSFLETSLIKKAQEKNILQFDFINPRSFCEDKHQQVDDEIYGGGAGMLMKAKPVIDAVESIIEKNGLLSNKVELPHSVGSTLEMQDSFINEKNSANMSDSAEVISPTRKVFFLSPSKIVFNQQLAYEYSNLDHIIFVAGRYEGIDHRFQEYMRKKYPNNFATISMGQYVTLGGELPSMVMTEAIVRLIPGVIKEESSHLLESYDPHQQLQNIEYPQYTRPEALELDGYIFSVPEVLLNGNHAEIVKWREENTDNS